MLRWCAVVLVDPMGVHCPQGSELSGDVSIFCWLCVLCVLADSSHVPGVMG